MSTTTESTKKEFKMDQAFALWKNAAKSGTTYFTGKFNDRKLVAFYNTNKKNPKEPDIRVYAQDDEGKAEKEEYVSLWCNVSKAGKKYLSGKLNDKKLVGFINTKATEKQPYISVYYSDHTETKASEDKKDDLPF